MCDDDDLDHDLNDDSDHLSGTAWHGMARQGTAGHGMAGLGTAWQGSSVSEALFSQREWGLVLVRRQRELAAEYGVTQRAIGFLLRRETWKHVG